MDIIIVFAIVFIIVVAGFIGLIRAGLDLDKKRRKENADAIGKAVNRR